MSRTNKTAPWRIKAVSRPGVTCVERHNHEKGFCDLPALTSDGVSWLGEFVDGFWTCHWTFGSVFHFDSKFSCGCSMCSDQEGRKEKARKARYDGKREARDSLTNIAKAEDTDWETFLDHKHNTFRTTIDEDFRYYEEIAKELGLPEGTVVVGIDYKEGHRFDDLLGLTVADRSLDSPDEYVETYNLHDGTRGRVKI